MGTLGPKSIFLRSCTRRSYVSEEQSEYRKRDFLILIEPKLASKSLRKKEIEECACSHRSHFFASR